MDSNNEAKNSQPHVDRSPRPAPEYLSVPSVMYARIGQGYVDTQQQLQALWDAVYLTHPDKERLLRAYVHRIDQLRGGASPMLMDTAVELEKLASAVSCARETSSEDRHLFCSCGAVVTDAEYKEHQARGHN